MWASSVLTHRLSLAREVVAAVERCDWSDNAEAGKVAVYCGALQMLSAACRPIYPYHLGMVHIMYTRNRL